MASHAVSLGDAFPAVALLRLGGDRPNNQRRLHRPVGSPKIAAYAFLCGVAPNSFASLSIKLDAPVTSMPLGVLVTTRRNPEPRKVKE